MRKLTVNIDDTSAASIDSLLAHFAPFLKTHAVAAAAMRIGLEALAKEPTRLIDLLRNDGAAREARG